MSVIEGKLGVFLQVIVIQFISQLLPKSNPKGLNLFLQTN